MTEYRIVYQCQSKYGWPLFRVDRIVNGKFVDTILNYATDAECRTYTKQVIAGEGSFIVIPKTVKEIVFQ